MMKTRTRLVMGEGTIGMHVHSDGNAVHMEIGELNEQTTTGFKKELDIKEGNALTMEWGDPKKFIEWVGQLQVIANDIESKMKLKEMCAGGRKGCLADGTPYCPDACDSYRGDGANDPRVVLVRVPQMGINVAEASECLREVLDMLGKSQPVSTTDKLDKHINNKRCCTCVASCEPSKVMSMTMPEGNIICNFEGTMPKGVHKNGYCGAYAPKESK